ncbi:hydrolase [Streptomyces sp. 21So2-11]|uniref:hydrolase n=1 Tax=Streptomyces sp. 21So2-11 TaxID=3144408 RepID=UPI003219FFB9
MSNETAAPRPLAEAARTIAPLAAEHAAGADTGRRLHPLVAEAIVDAGFAHHFAPAGLAGTPGTFTELLAAADELGRGCAAAAWVASVTASAGRLTAFLPRSGQEEVWQKGRETVVAAGLMPAGTATPVLGGWRVTGGWPYVSGIEFSHWVLVAARTATAAKPEVRVFAVPRTDVAVEDTWFTLGMRGTGSNTVRLDDVMVPAERSVPLGTVVAGAAPAPAAPCHGVPLKAVNGLTLTAPLLGVARGAVRRWSELVGAKLDAGSASVSGATDRGTYEQVLARSDGEIDAAGLLLARVAQMADSGAVSERDTARNVRDCALAAELVTTAVDRLLRSAGTQGHAESEELQRRWRDVTCGAGHNALQFSPAAQLHARALLAGPQDLPVATA